MFLLLAGAGYFYLRSQNKNELELLKEKHHELQLTVRNYLRNMSSAEYSEDQLNELQSRVNKYKKQLSDIEEKINSIKKSWLLE